MPDPDCSRSVVIRHKQGLHARPAEMLARLAMGYQAQIDLVLDGHRIDAKSILNILTLGAAHGSELFVEARGADAREAVDALTRLVESDFDVDAFPQQGGKAG